MIKSRKLEIDEHGVNIIRNGIKFEHIDYSQIDKAEIKREFFQRNWIIGLLIGVLIIIVSFLCLSDTLRSFDYETLPTIDIRSSWLFFISQFIVFILGISITISSLKRSLIIYFWVKGKVKRIQILDIEKRNKVDELYLFLDERMKIEKMYML
ncbi:MAG: hypothetical protein GQ564_23680 [Bacteroidales bacterium]|nr:hypothetical protein [Bacteroidales bacterium]